MVGSLSALVLAVLAPGPQQADAARQLRAENWSLCAETKGGEPSVAARAEIACNELLAATPALSPQDQAMVYFKRGSIRAGYGHFDQVVDDMTTALPGLPPAAKVEALLMRGQALVDLVRLPEAIADLTEVLRMVSADSTDSPDGRRARMSRSIAYFLQPNDKLAMADLDLVVAAAPANAPALFVRSVVRKRLGDSQGGKTDRDAAIRLDKDIESRMRDAGIK